MLRRLGQMEMERTLTPFKKIIRAKSSKGQKNLWSVSYASILGVRPAMRPNIPSYAGGQVQKEPKYSSTSGHTKASWGPKPYRSSLES